ncbi:hypothetical protein BKA83DRAFT_4124232 [Pisolithus microcarpus]|nr:hypothetical protein BKA83DRAFT_4124232 [Pisolithus microcarpus]
MAGIRGIGPWGPTYLCMAGSDSSSLELPEPLDFEVQDNFLTCCMSMKSFTTSVAQAQLGLKAMAWAWLSRAHSLGNLRPSLEPGRALIGARPGLRPWLEQVEDAEILQAYVTMDKYDYDEDSIL